MADEPISALTQVGAPTGSPPYPTAFTNPSTGAMLEILDTTNTTMASTGTNSRIAPGDLIMGFTAPGTNITLTETAGIVTIASTASGVPTGNNAIASVPSGSNYNLGTSMGDLSTVLSISLPVAGTYLLSANVRCGLTLEGTAGQYVFFVGALYNATGSVEVPYSRVLIFLNSIQATISSFTPFQQTGNVGPVLYTVSGATSIHLQGFYGTTATVGTGAGVPAFISDSNGLTVLSSIRLY